MTPSDADRSKDVREAGRASRLQIVFNWLMGEENWQTRKDGYWGGSKDVAWIDELLAVLDAVSVQPSPDAIIEEAVKYVEGRKAGRSEFSDLWREIDKIENAIRSLKEKGATP